MTTNEVPFAYAGEFVFENQPLELYFVHDAALARITDVVKKLTPANVSDAASQIDALRRMLGDEGDWNDGILPKNHSGNPSFVSDVVTDKPRQDEIDECNNAGGSQFAVVGDDERIFELKLHFAGEGSVVLVDRKNYAVCHRGKEWEAPTSLPLLKKKEETTKQIALSLDLNLSDREAALTSAMFER